MRALRIIAWAGLLIALACPAAIAQQAEPKLWRADFSIEITLGEEFYERLEAQGEELAEESYGMLLDPVRGGLHFADGRRRIDMSYGPLHHAASIVDRRRGELLLLDYNKKTGWFCPLTDVEARLAEQGLPVISAEHFFLFWDEIRASLEANPRVKQSELGRREVCGLNCIGLQFKAPFTEISRADGIQLVSELPLLRRLDGEWEGSFWISEQHGLPVKMQMSYCGLNFVWQTGNFSNAAGSNVLFEVPRLYETEPLDAASLF